MQVKLSTGCKQEDGHRSKRSNAKISFDYDMKHDLQGFIFIPKSNFKQEYGYISEHNGYIIQDLYRICLNLDINLPKISHLKFTLPPAIPFDQYVYTWIYDISSYLTLYSDLTNNVAYQVYKSYPTIHRSIMTDIRNKQGRAIWKIQDKLVVLLPKMIYSTIEDNQKPFCEYLYEKWRSPMIKIIIRYICRHQYVRVLRFELILSLTKKTTVKSNGTDVLSNKIIAMHENHIRSTKVVF